MKKRSLIVIIILISTAALVILQRSNIIKITQNLKIQMYGEPIAEDGAINNKYFGINAESNSATTKGLNNVISYANKHGIEYIKLEKDIYTVNDSVYLKENIELDLNGSTIQYETNSKVSYAIFRINNVENVKVENGFLIGDRETHDFNSVNSTHEWGIGINIRSSKNIEISGIQISKMTGDGIYVAKNGNKKYEDVSENVKIYNCNIRENRRQGISIICGRNIEIFDNEIYAIDGTAPKAGIDCEANYDNEYCSNIKIYRNKIYNDKNLSILFEKNTTNAEVFDNELEGTIYIINAKDSITIKDNVMKNGLFKADVPERKINNGFVINNVTVEGNKFYNVNFEFRNNNNVQLSNNEINEGTITMQNSKVNIINNNIKNSSVKDYLYNFEKSNLSNAIDGKNKSEVYLKGNKIIGQYKTLYKGNDYAKIIEENM